jgi:2-polyprenyl-3-methyl-5-hydroxy-6-metoxy-1,4-benzoquinol methylase
MQKGELNPTKFEKTDFDIISSFEVIEHIDNPNTELASISKLLRKGGLFYCTTPNFNSLMRYYLKADYNIIEYPEHLSYYTRNSLTRVARKNGLKLIKFQSTGISISRFKASIKSTESKIIKGNPDEVLRENIEKRWYMSILKQLVNYILTLTNTGLALKGYFVKK